MTEGNGWPVVHWEGTPREGVPEFKIGVEGECNSCGKKTLLMPDPIVGQPVCRPCWDGMMFDDDD